MSAASVSTTGDSVISGTYSKKFRIGGMGSGMDTDAIVKQLMQAESIPLDKLKQKLQLNKWKQDDYRGITSLLQGVQNTYFNSLNPATNMLSQSSYIEYTSTSTDPSTVTITGSSYAVPGSHTIQINNLATAATDSSTATITKNIVASSSANFANAVNQNLYLDLDGVRKLITIDSSVIDIPSFQTAIDNAVGYNKVVVSDAGGGILQFNTVSGSNVNKIILSSGTNDALMTNLGFSGTDNLSNRLNTFNSLETIANKMSNPFSFDSNGNVALSINNTNFTFNQGTTLVSMINQINSSNTAGVVLQYDDINDKFNFISKQMGTGINIQLIETGSNFLQGANFSNIQGLGVADTKGYSGESFRVIIDGVQQNIQLISGDYVDADDLVTDLQTKIQNAFTNNTVNVSQTNGIINISLATGGGSNISIGNPISGTSALSKLKLSANYTAGKDASVVLDGQTLVRSTNSFTTSGITYNLLKEGQPSQTVTLTQDVDSVYNNIKSFIDQYNSMIDTINKKISEDYHRDYQPLTDAQRASMNQEDVKKWEEKANEGLLRNDQLLSNIVTSVRNAMYDPISGYNGNISNIGITTGAYQDKGKLNIDEHKLKRAIENDPDGVMNLFVKQSEDYPYYLNYYSVTGISTAQNALTDYTASNKSFNVTIDGNAQIITLNGSYSTYSDLTSALQTKIQSAFSNTPISVTADSEGFLTISLSTTGSDISLSDPTSGASALSDLGFPSLSTSGRIARYNEEGLAYRLSDIINDAVRTSRDRDGNKGTLIEKAGLVGDASETTNIFYKIMSHETRDISEMKKKLTAKEDSYYKKFTNMEEVISRMSAQSNWIAQQLGGGTH